MAAPMELMGPRMMSVPGARLYMLPGSYYSIFPDINHVPGHEFSEGVRGGGGIFPLCKLIYYLILSRVIGYVLNYYI